MSGYHTDTPITIKAEPFIWPTAAFINIHEHPLQGNVLPSRQQLTSDHEPACMCHLYRLRINTHMLTITMPCFIDSFIARQVRVIYLLS